MTHAQRYTLTVTVKAPFLTQSSAAAAFGLDAAVARNENGQPFLPGTLITGHLRHAWNCWSNLGLNGAKDCLAWLGEKSGDETVASDVSDYLPHRKRLLIGDLSLTSNEKKDTSPVQRIRIDNERGAVEKGAMLIIEQPWAPQDELKFTGTVRFYGTAEAAKLKGAIVGALRWAGQVGAERGVGFGEIQKVELAKTDANPDEIKFSGTEIPLRLELTEPFCIAERNAGNNLFEGRNIIPGAAIKGALASSWAALLGKPLGDEITPDFDMSRPRLCQHFHLIAFRHALPGKENQRAVVPPQSLVKTREHYRDVALCEAHTLFQNEAPAFQIDWKGADFDKVFGHFGWPDLRRTLRVRTAINPDTGRAEDNKLFAYESVVPQAGCYWHSKLSLDGVPADDQPEVAKQLASLLTALGGEIGWLGKTKAFARVGTEGKAEPAITSTAQPGPNQWIVTLQTDALIGDWRQLDESAGMKEMFALYAQAFNEMSGGALNLVRHFARQKLAGGRYLHRRFRDQGATYCPWLLTEAGSVFVLESADDAAKANDRIGQWLKSGLPIPQWMEPKEAGQRWKTIPYLPEGGYGEIAVNLDCHFATPLALNQD